MVAYCCVVSVDFGAAIRSLKTYYLINTKNCSLSIVLTAMDQKLQKSLKR